MEPGLFLQAVLLLDAQLKLTPRDNELRLLLVQLYLILGCASYAYQLWIPLDVKRTIQDALSPLFFDRISSISPGLFQSTRSLMEPLRAYYNNTLRTDCPPRIWDAFSSGSYTSILDITEYDSSLRRSCTMMMTLVEDRRATRCFGGKMECEIEEHPLVGEYVSLPFSWISFLTSFISKYYGQHRPGQQDRLRLLPQSREPPRPAYPRVLAPRAWAFSKNALLYYPATLRFS